MISALSYGKAAGSVAASAAPISPAVAAVSFTRDIDAAVASRSGRLVLPFPRGAVSQDDDGDNDNGRQNDQRSAQSAPSPIFLHLKVIDND